MWNSYESNAPLPLELYETISCSTQHSSHGTEMTFSKKKKKGRLNICILFRKYQILSPDPENASARSNFKFCNDHIWPNKTHTHTHTHTHVRHTVCPPPNNKGRTKNRDLFSMVPVMKRNRRLRPRFLYEPLSCILHTSSCLKDDPAWGWNMKTKWEKSRLTIYCCIKRNFGFNMLSWIFWLEMKETGQRTRRRELLSEVKSPRLR